MEKGTTNGTITDVDGRFSLNVSEGAVLLISFVGYEAAEISAVGNDLQINLKPDSEQLEEVVVVGYGEQKRETLTGSVVNVSGKTIQTKMWSFCQD